MLEVTKIRVLRLAEDIFAHALGQACHLPALLQAPNVAPLCSCFAPVTSLPVSSVFLVIHIPPCSQSHLPRMSLIGHTNVYVPSRTPRPLRIKSKIVVEVSQAGSNGDTLVLNTEGLECRELVTEVFVWLRRQARDRGNPEVGDGGHWYQP